MRHRLLAVPAAVILGLGLAACGGGGEDDPAPTTDDLAGAVLGQSDVPEGFESEEVSEDSDAATTNQEGCSSSLEARAGEPAVSAPALFAKSNAQRSSRISASVAYYENEAALSSAWDEYLADLGKCDSKLTGSAEGTEVNLTVTIDDSLTLAGADDQVAVTIAGTYKQGDTSTPVSQQAVLVRLGSYVSSVATEDVGRGANAGSQIGDLTASQFERVRGLAD